MLWHQQYQQSFWKSIILQCTYGWFLRLKNKISINPFWNARNVANLKLQSSAPNNIPQPFVIKYIHHYSSDIFQQCQTIKMHQMVTTYAIPKTMQQHSPMSAISCERQTFLICKCRRYFGSHFKKHIQKLLQLNLTWW